MNTDAGAFDHARHLSEPATRLSTVINLDGNTDVFGLVG